MRKLITLLFLSLVIVSCRENKQKAETNLTNEEKVIMKDTTNLVRNGNKLELISKKNKDLLGNIDINIGRFFIDQIKVGIYPYLDSLNKGYFDIYSVNKNALDYLKKNRPNDKIITGLRFTFVEIKNTDLPSFVNYTSPKNSAIYIIGSYELSDGTLYKDKHYIIFNLINGFDPQKNILTDLEFQKLENQYSNDIYKDLNTYAGNNNTKNIFYHWGDIYDLINNAGNNQYINFSLSEIVNINVIEAYINQHPELEFERNKYRNLFSAREKHLTILGAIANDSTTKYPAGNSWFDAGDLRP